MYTIVANPSLRKVKGGERKESSKSQKDSRKERVWKPQKREKIDYGVQNKQDTQHLALAANRGSHITSMNNTEMGQDQEPGKDFS